MHSSKYVNNTSNKKIGDKPSIFTTHNSGLHSSKYANISTVLLQIRKEETNQAFAKSALDWSTAPAVISASASNFLWIKLN